MVKIGENFDFSGLTLGSYFWGRGTRKTRFYGDLRWFWPLFRPFLSQKYVENDPFWPLKGLKRGQNQRILRCLVFEFWSLFSTFGTILTYFWTILEGRNAYFYHFFPSGLNFWVKRGSFPGDFMGPAKTPKMCFWPFSWPGEALKAGKGDLHPHFWGLGIRKSHF